MREDVIGRANVEDTPELDAYYSELGRQQSYALWTVANSIEPWQPQPTSLPTLWSYAALRPLVLQALDMVSPEKAGRRVIALENPGPQGPLGLRRLALYRAAGDAAGRVRHRAQSSPRRRCASSWKAPAATRWSTATR